MIEPQLDANVMRHFSKADEPSAQFDQEELRKYYLTVAELAARYEQAGFQFVESHDFLSSVPGVTGYGGQVFLVLEKPGSTGVDDPVPGSMSSGI